MRRITRSLTVITRKADTDGRKSVVVDNQKCPHHQKTTTTEVKYFMQKHDGTTCDEQFCRECVEENNISFRQNMSQENKLAKMADLFC